MTGRYLHRPTVDTHRCDPPDADFLRWVHGHPVGTVWECPCGRVWHVVHVPIEHRGGHCIVAHREWRPETRRQRRQRLGLRWWQKEAR